MKCVAKGVYPINTGKVSIGAMYIPKKPHYCTDAELWTQNLLLRSKKRGTKSPTSVISLCRFVRGFFVRG